MSKSENSHMKILINELIMIRKRDLHVAKDHLTGRNILIITAPFGAVVVDHQGSN